MSQPSGLSFLTARQWLQQSLPHGLTDFGPLPSRRNRAGIHLPFIYFWRDVPVSVDEFVQGFDDTIPRLPSINLDLFSGGDLFEDTVSDFFMPALRLVKGVLRVNIIISRQPRVGSSSGPRETADQVAAGHAASRREKPDGVVFDGARPILVIELKRFATFRRTVDSDIPRLEHLVYGRSTLDDVMLDPVIQLYGYMVGLNVGYGILSSFDLTYVVRHGGLCGDILFISEGFSSTSTIFLGVLAYMLRKAHDEPVKFQTPVPKSVSPPPALPSLKRQGSEGDSKGEWKGRSAKRRPGMMTRSQGLVGDLPETPAELLHLSRHYFATGWSGKIVRGTYEGQSIVVKLAPIGSDRAEALKREVLAYHKLKEFWGKYVPQLVLYGTTVGGTIMFIATEEFNGYEIGRGPLAQEVVKEMFDALGAIHQCGILHGDIRPSNILVAQGERACVRFLDFGFACFDTSDEGCKRECAQLESLVSEFYSLGC